MTQTEVTATLLCLSANTRAPVASVVTSAAGQALVGRDGAQLGPGRGGSLGCCSSAGMCRDVLTPQETEAPTAAPQNVTVFAGGAVRG